jgi:hypothetical protein
MHIYGLLFAFISSKIYPKDKPSSNSQAPTISNPQQLSRKRQNITALESNTKKGPGFVKEIEVPPDTPPSTPSVFNLGSFEKAPARAIFKAARKGKKKMVSDISQHLFWT